MRAALIIRNNGVGHDWTAADFDSFTVLAELGAPRPGARVNLARRSRPLRRAVRAVLRTTALAHPHRTTQIRKAVSR
jgi:hypothetical protein